MAGKYILGIDQSTQGTKLLLFDEAGKVVKRVDRPHRQIVNALGWVSHDMDEIYANILSAVRELMEQTGIHASELAAIGISNQRETTVAWDSEGKPCCPAVVWQCSRASEIAERVAALRLDDQLRIVKGAEADSADAYTKAPEFIQDVTGLPLSPFFSAAKMRYLLEHDCKDVPIEQLHMGTVDSYLIYRMTEGRVFATDASNASRTQLMELDRVQWSEEVCEIFGIPMQVLPQILDSNGDFGETDFDGVLDRRVPILCAMGDSHGALFGQHCHESGMMKTTYGTGSSMMLNTGEDRIRSRHGLAASLAWSIDGKPSYVLEGNINYTGAVISWLKDDLELIQSAKEVNELCARANPEDTTVVVPAFTGLSAPYWVTDVKAAIVGMSRTTRKAELARAAVESIAQQITDVYAAMREDFGQDIPVLRADGGPTGNPYLMQFQSDMTNACVFASEAEELSAIGVAYLAGITAGVYNKTDVFQNIAYREYHATMEQAQRDAKRAAWKAAVDTVLH